MNTANPDRSNFGKKNKLQVIWSSMVFAAKNKNYFKVDKIKGKLVQILTRANIELGKMNYNDPLYAMRVREYDQAVLELERGRYRWNEAIDSNQREDWQKAFKHLQQGFEIGKQLYDYLISGSTQPISFDAPVFKDNGTEILFVDDVPLPPIVMPIVFLEGSDFDMGYQYAQQVIQIYGKWVMERRAGSSKKFNMDDYACLRKWEEQLKQHAPEILEMCKGWSAGAKDSGVVMEYDDVLDLWTGHKPPATFPFNINEVGLPDELTRPFCSGMAAWGDATTDHRLVTGSSGDHNPDHAAAIMAFPETGNNFFFIPFHVTGSIKGLPPIFMLGHPGMNNKGLAYVEHGGEPRMAEPMNSWGYGLRKGTVIFHTLRFANSAKEALKMELSYPIGDVGTIMGSAGCFWADSTYGFVPESRGDPVAVREAGMLGETDFMYACNGLMHPDLKNVWWMDLDKNNWLLDPHAGWYPRRYKYFERGMMGKPWDIVDIGINFYQRGNRDRCLHFWELLNRAVGKIDFDYMKMIYRTGGTLPPGRWEEITKAFEKTGEWGKVSPAHSTNAVVTIMKPDKGNDGIVALCHGEARRGLVPFSPRQAIAVYSETNSFWELKLASSPEEVMQYGKGKAQEYLDQASNELLKIPAKDLAYPRLKDFLDQAYAEFNNGLSAEKNSKMLKGNASIYALSKATRAYTRAQVRALQVVQARIPPPSRPEDLAP